jgi:protein-S-isoprenylcysteine O-methyltransferase Ste14
LAERVFVWTGGAVFVASLLYGAFSYAVRWAGAADGGGWRALVWDALIVSVFAAHHSIFAREGMKRRLARSMPDHLLRSVYVWTASSLFLGICAAWRPVGGELFHATGAGMFILAAVQLLGVWVIARAVGRLDPLELAGIRQLGIDRRPSRIGTRESAGDVKPATGDQRLTTDGPYGLVRHPLYLGWILIVFGAARLTGDRLAFAVLTTLYLIVAIPWEERSLARSFGDEYVRYRRLVRWRVIPFIY